MTTREDVRAYLIKCGVAKLEVDALLDRHKEVVEDGLRMRSRAYYIGDQILRAEEPKS